MKITVRKVDPRNAEIATTLKYLQKKCLPSDSPYDVQKGHWWIAYADNIIPVGFAGLVRSISWWDCGYLCRAGVLTEYTGKGIQKRLIKAREAQAKKLGWNWLITDTRDNPASSNNLISCGFKLYNPTHPWGFKDALYWRKKLNAVQRPSSKKRKASPVLESILRKK
jgi:GNAT superfamily N-acetyltransferase